MTGTVPRVAWGIVREAVFAFLVWIAALTGLFVLVHLAPGGPAQLFVGPEASVEQGEAVRAQFGVTEPLYVRWLLWLWNYTTLGYGRSFLYGGAVRDLVLPGIGRSLLLAGATTLIGTVLSALGLAAADATTGSRASTLVRVPASLAAAAPPLVAGLVLLSLAFAVDLFPTTWPGGTGRGTLPAELGFLLLVGFVIALPLAGLAIRRGQRWLEARRAAGEASGLSAAVRGAGGDEVATGVLAPWLYVTYFAGTLIVVENLFAYPGVGNYWTGALFNRDVPTLLGASAAILTLLVAAGFLRSVVRTVGEVLAETGRDRAPDGQPAAATDGGRDDRGATDEHVGADGDAAVESSDPPDDEGPVGPGGAADATRAGPDASAVATIGEGRRDEADVGATRTEPPGATAALRTALVRPKVGGGAAYLGLLLVVGLVGSSVLSPESPAASGGPVAVGPGVVVNSLGTFAVVGVGVAVVGAAVGVPSGAIAGYLETRIGGIPGRAAATALGLPSEVALPWPAFLAIGLWLALPGTGGGRTGFELLAILAGGAIVAAYAFQLTATATSARLAAGHSTGGGVAEGAVAALSRLDGPVVVVTFVAAELSFVGVLPVPSGVPAFVQLQRALAVATGRPGFLVVPLLQAILAVSLPALGVYLLADGLAAGADELRADRG